MKSSQLKELQEAYYKAWLDSDPQERTNHAGFMAGWNCARNFMAQIMFDAFSEEKEEILQ